MKKRFLLLFLSRSVQWRRMRNWKNTSIACWVLPVAQKDRPVTLYRNKKIADIAPEPNREVRHQPTHMQ